MAMALSDFPPPAWVSFIGALLVAGGAFWWAQWTTTRSAESSKRLTELQEQLRDAQEKANTVYSGGDSFCYVDISRTLMSSDPFAMRFFLRHVGDNTVSDIRVRLLDMKGAGFDTDEEFEFSTLNRGDWRVITALKIKSLQVDMYGVRISARNGKVSQDIKIARVKDHWSRYLKVFVTPNNDHTLTPEARASLADAINQQRSVGGYDAKLSFDIADGGRVSFERTDTDFPVQ